MKIIGMVLSFLLFLYFSTLTAQTAWQKFGNNPVMVRSNNWWEWRAIGQPTCIVENDTAKMWYGAAGALWPPVAWLFYAYSVDETTWVKHGTPVLHPGAAGEWDSGWLDTPEIVKDTSEYKLYYYGDSVYIDTVPPFTSALGLATSPDGINWSKYPNNPIFERGDSADWDGLWIESPALLFENDTFKMWYTGMSWQMQGRIGYAYSTNGIDWIKHPANPVIDIGAAGSWEDKLVGVPAVIKTGPLYELWYCGISAADWSNGGFDTLRIGYAYSTDGINWIKHGTNPVLSTFDPPYNPPVDSGGPWAPDVVLWRGEYKMWFETQAGFCLATAPVGIKEVIPSRPVAPQCKMTISPNPFTTSTAINLTSTVHACVELKIFDVSGRIISTISFQNTEAQQHEWQWSGSDEHGVPVPSGIYFCNVLLDGKVAQSKKMIVIH